MSKLRPTLKISSKDPHSLLSLFRRDLVQSKDPSLPSPAHRTLRVRRPTQPARQARRRIRTGPVGLSGQTGQREGVRNGHGESESEGDLLGGGGVRGSQTCPGPRWGMDEVQVDRVGVARSREEGRQTGIGRFVGERPRGFLGRNPQSRQRRPPSRWR